MDNPYGDPLERLRNKGPRSARDVVRARKPVLAAPKLTRIYVMAGLFIVFAIALPKLLMITSARAPVVPPDGGVPAVPTGFNVPELPAQQRLRELAALVADGEEAPPIGDPTMAEMLKIVGEITDSDFALRIDDRVGVHDLLREPSSHRAAFVRVFGPAHVVAVNEGVVEAYVDDVASGAVVQLYFRKDDEVPDDPWLRAEGAYIRPTVYHFTDGVSKRAAVVLAQKVEQAEPHPRTPEPDVPTDPAVRQAEIQRLVAEMTDGDEAPSILHPRLERIARLLSEGGPPTGPARTDLAASTLIEKPAAHRGAFVRFSGRVVNAYASEQPKFLLDRPGVNAEEVYLWDQASDDTICFYFINDGSIKWTVEQKPASGAPVHFINDWMEIEGVFLRTYTYDTKLMDSSGRHTKRTAAVVFATSVRKTAPPPPPPDQGSFWVVMTSVAAAVIVGLGVLAVVMNRRHGGAVPLRERLAHERKAKA